jgi:hypothetical protein
MGIITRAPELRRSIGAIGVNARISAGDWAARVLPQAAPHPGPASLSLTEIGNIGGLNRTFSDLPQG